MKSPMLESLFKLTKIERERFNECNDILRLFVDIEGQNYIVITLKNKETKSKARRILHTDVMKLRKPNQFIKDEIEMLCRKLEYDETHKGGY